MSIPWTKRTYFNIKWNNGPNMPASPLVEITRDEFLRLYFCDPWMVEGLNYGGHCSLPESEPNSPRYTFQYYFFHRHALAVASRYMNTLRHQGHPPTGKLLASDGDNGYDMHYYRLGCQHPKLTTEWIQMHDRQDKCPDCGFSATYDTSG